MKDKWSAFVDESVLIEPKNTGKLDGLSFTVKDVFSLEGYKNRAGSPDWYKTHGPAEKTSPVITTLLEHGATLRGVAHTDEMMYSLNGENVHYGTPVNPIDSTRIPGGSSSGSAVAVSAEMVDFSLGTDTGGSVRIPSSYCGIYGIRPTHGAVSIDGVVPLAKSFDTVGWMAREIDLLLEIGTVLLEPNSHDQQDVFQHVYLPDDAWTLLDQKTKEALVPSIPAIEERVKHCEWVTLAEEGLAEWANAFRVIQGIEIWREHGEWIQSVNPSFGPGIKERFEWTSTLKASQSENEFTLKEKVREELANLLGKDGLLVIPTAPGAAPIRNLHGEMAEQYRSKTMQLTCIAGLAGLPQVTMPFNVAGLPIGLSFIANRHKDMQLLQWVNTFVKK